MTRFQGGRFSYDQVGRERVAALGFDGDGAPVLDHDLGNLLPMEHLAAVGVYGVRQCFCNCANPTAEVNDAAAGQVEGPGPVQGIWRGHW